MKKQIPPAAIAAVILVILGVVAVAYWRLGESGAKPKDASTTAMPPQVTQELQKRMSGVQPPVNGGQNTLPGSH